MKIPEEEIALAMQSWGYTRRDAEFLWIVTAFSGHFVREQYRRYCDIGRGKADHGFAERLLRNGHVAGVYAWGTNRRTQRYHVHARALYRTFGRENSNHRKPPASSATIAVRLAALDFVLGEPEAHYLLSDEERLAYLREVHDIHSPDLVPSRTYPPRGARGTTPAVTVPFPDRFPMSVGGDGGVTFTFIDVPDDSLQPFEAHVARYAPLLSSLKTPVRFVFVSGVESKRARAEGHFRSAMGRPALEMTPELVRYFELEERFSRQDFAGMRKRDYDERADLAKKYSGPAHRKLFDLWRSGGLRGETVGRGTHIQPLFLTADAPSLHP